MQQFAFPLGRRPSVDPRLLPRLASWAHETCCIAPTASGINALGSKVWLLKTHEEIEGTPWYFPFPHTCSETAYRIIDVECIKRAKNTSVKSDRNGWMIRSEKLCEGNLSTSLLEGSLSLCSFGCSAGFPHQDAQAQQSEHRLLLLSLFVSFREMDDDDMKPEVKEPTALCEGNLSTSLLEGLTSSDAAQSDCENPCKLKLSSKMTSTRGPHTKVQVLHLLRWITHTPRSSGAFVEGCAELSQSCFSS